MKEIIEKRWITLAFGLALNAVLPSANAALSLTFSNGVGHPTPGNAPCTSTAWPAGTEFRWCTPTGGTVLGSSGENATNGVKLGHSIMRAY